MTSEFTSVRMLLAHPKGLEGDALNDLVGEIAAAFRQSYPEAHFSITTGKENFERGDGNWNTWAYNIANAKDFLTQRPKYTSVIVPGCIVGKGVKSVVEAALAAGKQVWSYGGGKFSPVVQVAVVDSENWKAGWELR